MLLFALLLACSAPPEAPQELDELVGYFFAHTNDADEATLAVGADNLDTWMDTRLEETLDGYSVKVLAQSALDALDDHERPTAGLVGAAVGHESPHDVTLLAAGVITTDAVERDPDVTLSYRRESDDDAGCFLDHECDTYTYTYWATDALPLGLEVSYQNVVEYRWFTMNSGEPGLVTRQWMADPAEFNVEWLQVQAQYYSWVSLPHDGGSRNMYALWAQTQLTGTDVPEDLALNLAIGSMSSGGDKLDAWVTENPPEW